MPIIPSVFQPVRSNDVQSRPFKAFKTYNVGSAGFTTGSGYLRHDAIYRRDTPHILADSGLGVDSLTFAVNPDDNTNEHVAWNAIDHRYYRNYGPAFSHDFIDIELQERNLWYSASIFTAPYGQVGERIKAGSCTITSSRPNGIITNITLTDDNYGNLRDAVISTSSMASSSRNVFYMSFNDLFHGFRDYDSIGEYSGRIRYELNNSERYADLGNAPILVNPGIDVSGIATSNSSSAGLSIQLTDDEYIRIPHHETFDRFNKCDDWTISFWHSSTSNQTTYKDVISKYAINKITYEIGQSGVIDTRDVVYDKIRWATSSRAFNNTVTPFAIGASRDGERTRFYFHSSNGTDSLTLDSGQINTDTGSWHHISIRNSASICEIFVDGVSQETGTLPEGIVSNKADVILGSADGKTYGIGLSGYDQELAEIRMYDYALTQANIDSLANRHYLSGSFMQTNVAGNVFYRNGQFVISSPLPKYNELLYPYTFFNNHLATTASWAVQYRGTHTIYENEVLVRVPADQFNVTVNPSATYRPITEGEPCTTNQTNLLPGELRKALFVSGTLVPYITSIGLYDDQARLLAVAKLATPVQKRNDVDTNFIIRYDF